MSTTGVPLLSAADRIPFTNEKTFVVELLQPALLNATREMLGEGLMQDGDLARRCMEQDISLVDGLVAPDELSISHHSASFRLSMFHFDHFAASMYQNLRMDYNVRVQKLKQLLGSETMSKNIVNIVQAFCIVAFLHHDARNHHFSDAGVVSYTPDVWIRYWMVLQETRVNYRNLIVQYLYTMFRMRCKNSVQRVYASAFANYIFDLGAKVLDERRSRYLYIDQECFIPLVCEVQRAFLQGTSEVAFWLQLDRCKCHGEGVAAELMRVAASDIGNAYPLSIKLAILVFLSWTHGFPFVNYAPNKQQFINARSHRSWAIETLEKSHETFAKQIAMRIKSPSFDCDRISQFLLRHLTFLHTGDSMMAKPGKICILCVDNKKCDLCVQ